MSFSHDHGSETRGSEVPTLGPTNRSFGLTFATVFGLIGLWSGWSGGAHAGAWLSAAAVFLVLALAAPRLLGPLNRAWARFGAILHRIMQPVILGLLFFVAITPIAFIARLTGHRPLRLHFDSTASTYWAPRTPPGPDPKSLRNQF